MSSWSTSGPPPFTLPTDDDVVVSPRGKEIVLSEWAAKDDASAYDEVVAERDAAVSRLHHYTERYDRERDDLLKQLAEATRSRAEWEESLEPAESGGSVNHPKHYNSDPSGIETIRFIEHKTFNIGNAIKYLDRSPYKVNQIEDLEKAIWYVNREIGRLDKLAGEVS
jgi:hypothetical protein